MVLFSMTASVLAQDSLGISYIGNAFDYWKLIGEVVFHQDDAIVANGYGISIFDMEEPETPQLIGVYSADIPGSYWSWEKLTVSNDILFLECRSIILTLDISDHQRPKYVNHFEFEFEEEDTWFELLFMKVNANELVLFGNWWLPEVDHERPEEKVIIVPSIEEDGSLQYNRKYIVAGAEVRGEFDDVVIWNDIAFCLGDRPARLEDNLGGIYMVDLANDPREVNNYSRILPNDGSYFASYDIVDDYLFCLERDREIKIFEVVNSDSFIIVDSLETDNAFQIITIDDDTYTLIRQENDETRIISFYDASNPFDAELLSEFEIPLNTAAITIGEDLLLLTNLHDNSIYIYKISDLYNTEYISRFSPDMGWLREVKLFDELLVTTTDEKLVRLLNANALPEIDIQSTLDLSELLNPYYLEDFTVKDQKLYCLNAFFLHSIDISDPEYPVIEDHYRTQNNNLYDFVIVDDIIYLTGFNIEAVYTESLDGVNNDSLPASRFLSIDYADGFLFLSCGPFSDDYGEIFILDEEQFRENWELDYIGVSNTDLYGIDQLIVKDGYAYAKSIETEEDAYRGYYGFSIIDIHDPTSPELVYNWHEDLSIRSILVDGDRLFLTCGEDGLLVFDLSNMRNPYLIGYYNGDKYFHSMAIRNDLLISATNRTLEFYDISQLSAPFSEFILPPSSFSLSTPYPNPFNSSTRLTYNIPTPGTVTLKLFDIDGRQVKLLEDGYRQAGSYVFTLQAGGLPSGEYILQLNSDKMQENQKLLLLK